MATKKTCFPGLAFDSLDALLDWIDSGYWVFIGSKAYRPSFVRNRVLGRVREECRNGTIRACYDENGSPYVSPNSPNFAEFYAENDGTGIIGWSFDCPFCGYSNRFVTDEDDPDHECGKCHKAIRLSPITYSALSEI